MKKRLPGYNRRLYGTVLRILQNPTDVEDVLQQAHLRALQHFGQFERRSNILTWLTPVVVNEAYNYLRPGLPAIELRRHSSVKTSRQ